MLDATCAPSNIRYPQDYSLLNEAREKLEHIQTGFVKAIVSVSQEHIVAKPERTIQHWQKAKNVAPKRFVKPYASNQVMFAEALAIWNKYMIEGYASHRKK